MTTIEGTARTTASREAVWALIADIGAWPRWGTWSHAEVEGGGEQRLGAVRVLVQRPFRVRERITGWEPGREFAYEMLDGMNVTGYRSVITLEDAGGGQTLVRWRSTFERAGLVTGLVLRLAVPQSCKRLAKAAR